MHWIVKTVRHLFAVAYSRFLVCPSSSWSYTPGPNASSSRHILLKLHLAGVDKDDVAPKTIAEVVEPILSNTPILIETFKKAIGYSSVLGMWQANVHDSL
jgi:hypothetical protein